MKTLFKFFCIYLLTTLSIIILFTIVLYLGFSFIDLKFINVDKDFIFMIIRLIITVSILTAMIMTLIFNDVNKIKKLF
jgi:hypothetical protein